jgi:hypothetical protein
MQRVQRSHKRTAAALLVLATGLAGVTVSTSSALGQTRKGALRTPKIPASALAPQQVQCKQQQSCVLNRKTGMSTVTIAPTEVPAGSTPSFTAPTSSPTQGMLNGQGRQGMLTCGSYSPTDPVTFQFFIGGTFRANIFYKVTDIIDNPNPNQVQFCLGATFHFTTLLKKQAAAVTLPNGLPGFAGLLPACKTPVKPPCVVSKRKSGRQTVLNVWVPAVGDPWGRA